MNNYSVFQIEQRGLLTGSEDHKIQEKFHVKFDDLLFFNHISVLVTEIENPSCVT